MTSRGERDRGLDALEHEVLVLVRRARRVIAARAAQVHPDLSPASYLLMGLVRDRGQVRAADVCDAFDLDKGAVSRQVQQMAELGLVERTADPADRRATLITLTDAGREALEAVDRRRRSRLRDRLDEWDDAALADFVASLHRYNALFGSDEQV